MDSYKSSHSIAFAAILTALGWLFISASSLVPSPRFFMFLASLMVATAYFEKKLPSALLVLAGVTLLTLIYPSIYHALVFLIFIGPLPILILYLRDKNLAKILQYIIVHAVFTAIFLLTMKIIGLDRLISPNLIQIKPQLLWLVIILLLQLILFIYRILLFAYEKLYLERIQVNLRRSKK